MIVNINSFLQKETNLTSTFREIILLKRFNVSFDGREVAPHPVLLEPHLSNIHTF